MKTEEIKLCPFRIFTEVRPAVLKGDGDITITDFMPCLKGNCPAWYVKTEDIPCTGVGINKEYCKRLEK